MPLESREKVVRALERLVKGYGASLIREPGRCEALLRDLCPNEKREIAVLVAAIRHGICDALQAMQSNLAAGDMVSSLSARLYEEAAIDRDWALWGTAAWAAALGIEAGNVAASLPTPAAGAAVTSSASGKSTKAHGKFSSRRVRELQKSPSYAESLIVDGADGEGGRRLMEALEKAPQGARIYVRPGTYPVSLLVEKKVEIIGEGRLGEVMIASEAGPALTLSRDAYIHGLTFLYPVAGEEEEERYAVRIERGRGLLEDCRILSSSGGIHICGSNTAPLLRRCSVETSGSTGVRCDTRAKPVIESCMISCTSPASVGARISGGSMPLIRETRFSGAHTCVEFAERASGTLERCHLSGAAYACISVQRGANPTISSCTVEKGHIGIEVSEKGKGVFEDCSVRETGEGIRIADAGDPVIRRCTVQECLFGIRITQKGRGKIERSTIARNRYSGVSIKEQGSPVIRRCSIVENGDAGIWVHRGGRGTLEENDLQGNSKGGLHVESGSKVKTRANRSQ